MHQLLGTQGSTVWRSLATYIYGNTIIIAVGTAVYLKRTPGAAQETHIAHLRRLLGFPICAGLISSVGLTACSGDGVRDTVGDPVLRQCHDACVEARMALVTLQTIFQEA